MTELVKSGSVGGMASNGCLYPDMILVGSCLDEMGMEDLSVASATKAAVGSLASIGVGAWLSRYSL
jgi:hypothetical protein